jgi:hypothetical protein
MKNTILKLQEMQTFFEEKYLTRRDTDLSEAITKQFIDLAFKASSILDKVTVEKTINLEKGIPEISSILDEHERLLMKCESDPQTKDKNVSVNYYVLMSQNLILKCLAHLLLQK